MDDARTVSQRRPDMSDTAPQDDYASHTIGGDEDAAGFSAVVGLGRVARSETVGGQPVSRVSPPASPVRVFGGLVAAQALIAAGRTVPSERRVHSLHAYFLRGGNPRNPIGYQVDRPRDGSAFTSTMRRRCPPGRCSPG